MSRTIDNKTLVGRNILNKSVGNITKDITNIKNKYDFSGTVLDGSLLIGNGTSGFFETNRLTAGANVTINNTAGAIEIATNGLISSNWEADGGALRVISKTAYNYIELQRSNTGVVGLKLSNEFSSTEQNGYLYLSNDLMILEAPQSKFRFGDASVKPNIEVLNSADKIMLKYDSSSDIITFGNSTENVVLNSLGITGTAIKDEDNMSSNSATHLASQQSIKAYVDNTVGTNVLWEVGSGADAGAVKLKNESSYNYVLIKRNTSSGNTGFQLSNVNGGSRQDAYIYLNGTQNLNIESPNETIKFVETDINLINSQDKTLIKFDADGQTVGEITLGNTSNHIVMTGVGITGNLIKDEDDMNSNSATHLATQQSIKAYVDSKATLFQGVTTDSITNIENIDKTGRRYLKIERTVADTDFGFWIRRDVSGSTPKNAYLFLDNTENDLNIQIDTNTLRFFNTGVDALTIYNHQTADDREMIKYKKSTSQLTINNDSDSLVLDGSGISGTLIKDEDNMVSNSATHLATQQSIKAYVDSQSGSSKFETADSIYLQNIDTSTYKYIRIKRTDSSNAGFSMKNSGGEAFIYMVGSDFLIEPPSNNKIQLYTSSGAVQVVQKSGRVLIENADTPQLTTVGNSTDNLNLKGLTITSSQNHIFNGQINQILATSQAFKVLNGIFSNDDTDPKTIRLNTSGTNSFGLGQYTTFGSDVYTFCNNDTIKASFFGSYTSDCLFTLIAGNSECMTINPNYRNYFLFGIQNESNIQFQPRGFIHICNDTTDLNANDSKLVIESRTSDANYVPMLELIANTGTNSSSVTSFIYANSSSQLILQAPQEIFFNSGSAFTFKCSNTNDIVFQTTSGNLYGVKTASHPSHTKNPMNNIYASEIYSTDIEADGFISSFEGFEALIDYDDIKSFATTGPSSGRVAPLMLGKERSLASADGAVYPVMRINSPYAITEFYHYIQNSASSEFYGIVYSAGTSLDYILETNSSGNANCYGNFSISGALSKGSGSFKIRHPLDEDNKVLYHSFCESPRCDNIYSGKVKLKNGKATVNMDNNSYYMMSEGTFLALNKDFRIYVNNNEDFDRVLGKLKGNKLNILCENNKSNITVDWMVIGTRQDSTIIASDLTDEEGNLITEKYEPKNNKERLCSKKQNYCNQNFIYISKKYENKIKIINALHTAKNLKKNTKAKPKTLNTPQLYKQTINEPTIKRNNNKRQR
jgi:hypothetical protein